ncbi:hypothetical protein FVR98_19900 [Salmonella enterica]|nr:hypothetical protein [Salmonella enterica]EEO0592716.1 hypothetical protein [Salmonella enterica]
MGSCAAPSAKGDDKFITTDYLQQCLIKIRNALVHRNGVTESLEPVYISSGSVQNAICTVRAFITVAAETLLQEDALYRTDDGIF